MALKVSAAVAAKIAIQSIGCGYDISLDLRLKYCKGESGNPCLIEFDDNQGREIVLPGGISMVDVPKWIKCDKGERTRFQSDVLSFQQSIGRGYDNLLDLPLKYCEGESGDPRLIRFDENQGLVLPGGISMLDVPKWIKCDKGERTRFQSDVFLRRFEYPISRSREHYALHQRQYSITMSEQFNQEMSVAGKIPSGLFNFMFEFSGCWQRDASTTKTLAFDGVFITLYTVALEKSQLVLSDHVKKAVPPSWEPAALSRFIEKFGTHIIVGVKMGGKDVVYMKQQHQSAFQPTDVQKRLKAIADKRFLDSTEQYSIGSEQVHQIKKSEIREPRLRFADTSPSSSYSHKEDITSICKRRGGSENKNLKHNEWLQTVLSEPDVIAMSFIPITSLLNGVPGSGFLSHAINLYLRYKPPIEELHQFLEFQLPRQWAPVFSDFPLGPQSRQLSTSSLQFSFMGPKLYVNTTPVDVGKRPVTGLRLYLEGKRCNRLAIHLQHLSSLPKILKLEDDPNENFRKVSYDHKYYEKVQWKNFSHVCTAPVESDEDLSIVTGAQLQVGDYGFKRVLFLRLRFSTVEGATVVKHPEWDGSSGLARKSGLISTLMSGHFTTTFAKPPPQPAEVNINSAVYPGGPPVPHQAIKLLKFVDMTEMKRGPQESPGYWVVSGARLMVEKGRISLRVKYSLLTVILPDEELPEEH